MDVTSDRHPNGTRPTPWRDGIAAGMGAGLAGGIGVGLFDVVETARSAPGGLGFAPSLLALYCVPALIVGGYAGLVAGAVRAIWGERAIGRALARLKGDPELDRAAAAVVIAAAIALLPVLFWVKKASVPLVGLPERKNVGALLLGIATVGVIPLCGLLALPIYRGARRAMAFVPSLGPIPRVAVVVAGGVGLIGIAALYFAVTRLDWRALNLRSYAILAAVPASAAVIGWLAYGPLDGVRRRIPARGILTAAATVVAVALPAILLSRVPSDATLGAVMDHSWGGARLVGVGRALIDRDGDGYSPFFGGPDCDDHNPDVHPGAKEIANDGIDNDCTGGDRVKAVEVTGGPPGTGPAASAPAPTAPKPAAAPPFGGNVLFIMIDTLRADRIGLGGYQRDGKSLTPHLDAFAAQAVWFRHAYSQAPMTPRSVPSMMTSRYPSQIAYEKGSSPAYPRLADANDLLFEELEKAGLHTVVEASHFYFCKDPDCPAKYVHSNIVQGMDEVDDDGALDIAGSNYDSASPRIVPRVVDKLAGFARSKQRFAMFVHLFEPHGEYVEHEGYPITLGHTEGLKQKYDYEIAFMDGWLGKVFDELDHDGLAANTMVVIVSDHGEAFGVHVADGGQLFYHGQSLYDELIHVPVMIRMPGVAPRQVGDVTQVMDVAPTIVDLLGGTPPKAWKGRSLAPLLRGESLPARPAFAQLMRAPDWDHEGSSMISADGKYHLFYRQSDRRYELYDLGADPEEKHDLWDEKPDVGKAMQKDLADWIDALGDD